MLLRNLGVGIEQCGSQSQRCAAAGVGVQQGCSSNPAPSAGASPATVMRQAGRLKAALFALWLWRSIGTWPVQHDGHWPASGGDEKSGIRCILILIYGIFCVLGDSQRDGVSVGLRI
jgi:hypothetical protein